MRTLLIAAAALAASAFGGTVNTLALRQGENAAPAKGEVLALEAVTASASPSLKVGYVQSILTHTNGTAQSIESGRMYYFGLTNWNGAAYVRTNSWNRFDYGDWTALGTNHVFGPVASTNLVVTNTFTVKVAGPRVVVTNALFDASAANHYLMATNPSLRYISGRGFIVVSGGSDDDSVTLFVK